MTAAGCLTDSPNTYVYEFSFLEQSFGVNFKFSYDIEKRTIGFNFNDEHLVSYAELKSSKDDVHSKYVGKMFNPFGNEVTLDTVGDGDAFKFLEDHQTHSRRVFEDGDAKKPMNKIGFHLKGISIRPMKKLIRQKACSL